MKPIWNRVGMAACAAVVALTYAPAEAADYTWSGGGFAAGSNDRADNGLNYQGGVAPATGDTTAVVTFGNIGNAQHLVDFRVNTSWDQIRFTGGETYFLTSSDARGLSLRSGIDNTSTASHFLGLPVLLARSQAFRLSSGGALSFGAAGRVANQGHNLTLTNVGALAAPIGGPGGLIVDTSATVTLGGHSTYTGETLVYADAQLTLADGSISGSDLFTGAGARVVIGDGGRFGPAGGPGTNQIVIGGFQNGGRSGVTLRSGGVVSSAATRVGHRADDSQSSGGGFRQDGGTHATAQLTVRATAASALPAGYDLTAGTLTATDETIGNAGEFNQLGGTHTVTRTATVDGSPGAAVNTAGQFSLRGGTFTAGSLVVGDAGGGTFSQNGGTATAPFVYLGLKAGGRGDYTLAGGTLATSNILAVAGGGTFSFAGGTLQAQGSGSGLFSQGDLLVTVKAGGAKIDTNGASVTVNKPLAHDAALGAAADGGLTKSGGGTLALNGANTYTGDTAVTAGTLLVNGSLASPTTVHAGATLGGTGSAGSVQVRAGGTLAPGADGTGTFRAGVAGLIAGSTLSVELASSAAYDRLVADTLVSLGGDLDVNLLGGYVPPLGTPFQILTAGPARLSGAFANAPGGYLVDDGYTYRLDYGNGVTLTRVAAVPEPASLAAAAAALAGGLLRRRRRQDRAR